MATFPRAFLLNVPPEIVACVTDYLSASDVLALFLCGDTLLNSRLLAPGCVTRFNFSIDSRNVRFPTFAYYFTSLVHFQLNIGDSCKCFGVSRFAYSRLPQTLKSLYLHMDSPGYALVSGQQNLVSQVSENLRQRHLDIVLIDFRQTFPILETLVMQGSWNELSTPEAIYPPFLTNLDLGSAQILSPAFVYSLPTSLRRLKIGRNLLKDGDFAALPEALETLDIGFNNSLSSEFQNYLPRRLQHLSFEGMISSRAGFERLPTLKSLHWRSGGFCTPSDLDRPIPLPETIESLALPEFSLDEWILPPNLQHLNVVGRNTNIGLPLPQSLKSFVLGDTLTTLVLQQLPATLTGIRSTRASIDPKYLPPCLTSLELSSFHTPFSDTDMVVLQQTCRHLTALVLPHSAHLSSGAVDTLPSLLCHLELQNSLLNISNVKSLPPSLVHLSLNIQSNFNSSCALLMPANLTWLQVFQTSLGDTDISYLPRTLLCLVFSSTSPLSNAFVPLLPPKLTRLDVHSRTTMTNRAVPLLPRSLVELRCPNSSNISLTCIPDLPIGMSCVLFGNTEIASKYFEYQDAALSKRRVPRFK